MQCPKCKTVNSDNAQACQICGHPFTEAAIKKEEVKKQSELKQKKSNVWSWRTSDEEFNNQIENYKSLKFGKSFRSIAVIIAALFLFLSFFYEMIYPDPELSFAGIIISNIIIWIILSPILIFIYLGHRWAMITFLVLFSLDRLLSLLISANIEVVFWWAIMIVYYYKAIKVENERRKLIKSKTI